MEMRSIAVLLIFVGVVTCVPFDKELSRDRREREGEGPVVVVETGGGRGRGRNPFFSNPFFDDDSDDRFPALDDDDSSPKEGVEPSGPDGFGGFGMGPGFNGFDFFNRMNSWMRDLQRKMNTMWDRIYRQRLPNFPNIHNVDLDKFPDNYHNTTSTRKVVNGSVIVVNETIHKNADNDSQSFVHVKVFHMRPEGQPGSGRLPPPRRPNPEVDVPEKEFEEFPRPAGHGGEFGNPELSSPKTVETSTEDRNNEII